LVQQVGIEKIDESFSTIRYPKESKLKTKRKMSEIFEINNNKLSILSEGGEEGRMTGLATSELCGLASLVGAAAMASGKFSTLDAGPRQRV